MFDTAIIYKTFTRKTVNLIINRLKALSCRQRYFKSGRVRIFKAKDVLQRYGIKYIAMVNQPNDYLTNVYISFSVQGLCDGDAEHLFVPTASNKKQLKDNFDGLMRELGIVKGTGLESWPLRRLDCAVDVETSYADLYVQLMKKAKQPYNYKLLCDKEGSFYSGTKKRTTVFNHYDKTAERRSRGLQDTRDSSTPTLRLEVQIKSTRKLADVKKRHGFKGKSLLDFLRKDIAQDVIGRHDERFGLTGDYFSMAEATRLIKASNKQRGTKERMISFLKIVTKCQNVNTACQLYEAETGKLSKVVIRDLRGLGINPVTIPYRKYVQRLPGIDRQAEEVFEKLAAKNHVFKDKNSLFPRNENNVGTLLKSQLFASKNKISAGFRASATGHVKTLLLKVCISQKMVGKHKYSRIKKGSHMACDCIGGSNQSHYRGPP